MIENILYRLRQHRIETAADFVVVGIIWTGIPVLSVCLVKLFATLAGHIVGCL